ncbi:MAG: diadenylate cyclase [Planctomycetota bacterium]|jgi:diadenylate cyclase
MLEGLLQLVRSEPWLVATEVAVIWLMVWLAYRFLRGTRGGGAIKGFAVLLVLGTFLIRVIGQGSEFFERLSFLYGQFLGLAAIMLIVVFQPELRQAMIRLGHAWSFDRRRGEARSTATTIGEACDYLSRAKFGAIIAIERRTRLSGLAETGIELDALASPRLLQSIFYPNSPLHDLGVVIRGDRIAAASVQFPLAEEGVLPPEFGARHRAAVGLTLECDAIVVVVSEERGTVSVVERGQIEGPFDRETLVGELVRRLEGVEEEEEPAPVTAPGDAEAAAEAAENAATAEAAETPSNRPPAPPTDALESRPGTGVA